jgi:hypothetical protein
MGRQLRSRVKHEPPAGVDESNAETLVELFLSGERGRMEATAYRQPRRSPQRQCWGHLLEYAASPSVDLPNDAPIGKSSSTIAIFTCTRSAAKY